jgi:murein tripeptide amidase MpaA
MVFSICVLSAETYLITIPSPHDSLFEKYRDNAEWDIALYRPGIRLDLVVTTEQYQQLLSRDLEIEVLDSSSGISQRFSPQSRADDKINGYLTYEGMVSELERMEAAYPDIFELHNLGKSQGKLYAEQGKNAYSEFSHDIWAVKVSDNPEEEEDEPALLFAGAHHARECASMDVTMAILDNFLSNYNSDPGITEAINSSEIWFVPNVNPDGHKLALQGFDNMWRKNIRDNNNDGRITGGSSGNTGDGVDFNRNYAYEWGGAGASTNPSAATYRGPSAGSEPEIQIMQDFVREKRFVAGLTYHLYSELVLWGWGYTQQRIPDYDAVSALGRDVASRLSKRSGGTYEYGQSSTKLYSTSGDLVDYAYGETGGFFYTVELWNNTFWPPSSAFPQMFADNIEAAKVMVNRIQRAVLTGNITDSRSNDPLAVKIIVSGIDSNPQSDTYRHMSNERFGAYYRMLAPGTYTVTFSKDGYHDTTITDIRISDSDPTVLDVAMRREGVIEEYTLTVEGGTGSGEYEAGTEVTVTADDPEEGDVFGGWTGDTEFLADPAQQATTLTMPESDVSIAASYTELPRYEDNYLTVVEWSAEFDENGSSVSIDSSMVHSDTVLTAQLELAASNPDEEIWTWAKISGYSEADFSDVTRASINYISNHPFRLILEQEGLSDAGASYAYEIPAADPGAVSIPMEDFSQPEWVDGGDFDLPLDLSAVTGISFDAGSEAETTDLTLSAIQLDGYNHVSIGEGTEWDNSRSVELVMFEEKELTLSVPHDDTYTYSLFDLKGRQLMRGEAVLSRGINRVALKTPAQSYTGIYFLRVQSASGDIETIIPVAETVGNRR